MSVQLCAQEVRKTWELNMGAKESAQKAVSFSQSEMVRGLINRTLIVDWGTVKEVLGDGSVVQVLLSVTDNPLNTTIVTCVLVSPCSSVLSVNLTPKVGDKVLVLSPRGYDAGMFDVAEDTEVIVNPSLRGYNKMTCIAILYNQFRPDTHKNSIDLTAEGALNALLGYDSEDEVNNVSLSVLADGSATLGLVYDKDNSRYKLTMAVDTDGAYQITQGDTNSLSVDKDGAVELKVADKVTITIDKDGAVTVSNKAVINVDKDGNVTIDAKSKKVSIKNTQANLFTILNGMLTVLNSSLATAGSPANHTVVPNQFSTQAQQLGQLMQ